MAAPFVVEICICTLVQYSVTWDTACNGAIVERNPGVTNQGSEWGDSFNPLISPASAANTGTSNLENWTQKELDLFICCSQLTNHST